jgi:hypothetical protein
VCHLCHFAFFACATLPSLPSLPSLFKLSESHLPVTVKVTSLSHTEPVGASPAAAAAAVLDLFLDLERS